jgi:hypothetical protein
MKEWKIGDLVWSTVLAAFGIIVSIDLDRKEEGYGGQMLPRQLQVVWSFEPGLRWYKMREKNDVELMQD